MWKTISDKYRWYFFLTATSPLPLARIITRERGKKRGCINLSFVLDSISLPKGLSGSACEKNCFGITSRRVVNPFFYFLFPADSKWEELHPGGERPPALQEHSAVAYKDCLYIFGGELGFSAGTETPLWVYNVKVTYHLRPNLSLSPSRERARMRTSTERKGKSSSRLLDVSLEIVWLSHPPRLNFVGRNFVPSEFKRFDLGKWDKARGYLASSCRRGSTPLWSGKSNETPCWPWLTISCFDAFRYRGLRLRTLLFLLAWNWLFQSSSSSHRELRFFIISLSFSDRIDDDFS